LLACLLAAGDLRSGNHRAGALTTIGAIRASLAGPERWTRVDVQAVATFFDANEGVIYLQDGSAAVALRVGNPGGAIASGTKVGLTGEMKTGVKLPVVERAQITALELGASLPPARPVSIAALLDHEAPAEWVLLRGLVRSVVRRGDSLLLEVQDQGRRIHVAAPRDVDDPCLLGSRVRLRGVISVAAKGGAHGEHAVLLVPDRFYLRIEESPPARVTEAAASLPLIRRVSDLRRLKDAEARRGYPVHLVGVVTCCGPGSALFIDDGSAGTYIESRRHLQTAKPGDRVEVTGVSAGDFDEGIKPRDPLARSGRVCSGDPGTEHDADRSAKGAHDGPGGVRLDWHRLAGSIRRPARASGGLRSSPRVRLAWATRRTRVHGVRRVRLRGDVQGWAGERGRPGTQPVRL
jgi:hypothetical protein